MGPEPTLTLSNGVRVPRVGLGVFRAPQGAVTRQAVREALALGYRHVDTAAAYGNEADVGLGLRDSGVPRGEVFVTTKLWNADQGHDAALRAFDASAARLGLEVVDLYLLHWPVPGLRLASWRALESLYAAGRVRAIGVSNFMERHLDELLGACRVPPMVNQIEVHPFLQQRAVRAACARHGIAVEAYSPLAKGSRLAHPVVQAVAARLGRTPAQVMLRWGLEEGLVVLPKSTRPGRMTENADLFGFALDDDDRRALAGLEDGRTTGWDPREVP